MPEDMNKEIQSETPINNAAGNDGKQNDIKGLLTQLETFLDEYMVKKAPFHIPIGGKEFIASVSPYLIILGAIIFIPTLIAALGLTAVLSPFAMMGGGYHAWSWGWFGMISLITGTVALVFEIIAIPGLFKRTRASWRLVYYATVISLVGGILSLNLVGALVGAIISWYILFQVKELYKN